MVSSLMMALALLTAPDGDWVSVQPGVEYGRLPFVESPSHGDGVLHVVRIAPEEARLVVYAASAEKTENKTAEDWLSQKGLSVVINAGMYETDFTTHTGHLRIGKHKNNGAWVKDYHSLFVLKPDGQAQLIDRNTPPKHAERYSAVAQNLRLIRAPGKIVWSEQPRRWSEAALAMDDSGRILFLFTRTPLAMHDFNSRLLASDLGIVRAQHLEGGPEASLSIRAKDLVVNLSGSYETGFNENNQSKTQWPLPNVIGVVAAPAD
ncbi:MAG: phosphodiester glycosidase family protein [Myxococcota bacterium]